MSLDAEKGIGDHLDVTVGDSMDAGAGVAVFLSSCFHPSPSPELTNFVQYLSKSA